MSASAAGFFKDLHDLEDDKPGFSQDCHDWANWMALALCHPEAWRRIQELGLESLFSVFTQGMEEADIEWVTPESILDATLRLSSLIAAEDPRTEAILDSYEAGAADFGHIRERLLIDLHDVAAIAEYARSHGVREMTMEVDW